MGNNTSLSPLNRVECYSLKQFQEETPRKMTIHVLCDNKANCISFVEDLTGEKFPPYSNELLEIDIEKKINLYSFINYKIYDSPSKLMDKIKIKSKFVADNPKSVKCFFSEVVIVLDNEKINEQIEIIRIELENNDILSNRVYFYPFFIFLSPFDLKIASFIRSKTFHYKITMGEILNLKEKIKEKNGNNIEIFKFYKKLNVLFSYYNELGDSFSFKNSEGREELINLEDDTDISVFINILMLGRTGSGKSTLINLLLDEKKSLEGGTGFSTTSKPIKIYKKSGIPLRFYDLRGIENEETLNYYVNIMSKYNGKDVNSSDNINAIFYTMDYKKEGTIIEKMEEKIFEQLVKFERPILFIITKYPYPPNEIINIKDSQKSAREDGKKKFIDAIKGMIKNIFNKNNKNGESEQFIKDFVKFYFVNLVRDLADDIPAFGLDQVISFFTEKVSEKDWELLEDSCNQNDEKNYLQFCETNPFLKFYSDFKKIKNRNKEEALSYLKYLKAGAFFSGWIPGFDLSMEYYYRELFLEKLKKLYGFNFEEAENTLNDENNEIKRLNSLIEENIICDKIDKEVSNKKRNIASLFGRSAQVGGIVTQVGDIATQIAISTTIQVTSWILLPVTVICFGAWSCYNIHKDCIKILDIFDGAFAPLKFQTLLCYVHSFRKAINYLDQISKNLLM